MKRGQTETTKRETVKRSKDRSHDFPGEWEDRMRTIAREVFREAIHNTGNIMNVLDNASDMPPEPQTVKGEGKGRRETRKAQKISAMVDENLLKLFEAERKRRKLSTGKLLDAILWRNYGRPRLSYEPQESEVADA